MKNYFTNRLTLWAAIMTTFVMVFSSCDQDKKMSNSEFPELIQRHEKIQNGKEWDEVQNAYVQRTEALKKNPKDYETRLELAQLYIREARVTGEHGHYYPAALKMTDYVLADGEAAGDMRFIAMTTKAGVQLSLHEFSEALKTGTEAVLLNPGSAQIHGVLVDANVELGNYEKAVGLADRMINIKPDIRSYSRVSYLREIHGDVEGSINAMMMAVKAGYPGTEETSWAMLTLGDLYREYGQIENAQMSYESVLVMRPDYPFAIAALGDLEAEKGNDKVAEEKLNEAISIIPEVGFYVSLAELYKKQGRTDELDKIMKDILEMLADDEASGHNMNLEYANIYSDIMEDQAMALKYAQTEYEKRPENIDVNRLMGKIYLKMNDPASSKKYLDVASKTKSKNPELAALVQQEVL